MFRFLVKERRRKVKKKSQKSNGKISRNIVYLKYKKDAAMKRRQRVNEGGITRWA